MNHIYLFMYQLVEIVHKSEAKEGIQYDKNYFY